MKYTLKGSTCPHCQGKIDIEFETNKGKLISEKVCKTTPKKKKD